MLVYDYQMCVEPRPRTFAGLMQLAEDNYILLRRLVPDISALDCSVVSRARGCLDLHLQITGRWKFTSELILTYWFRASQGIIHEPDLHIRIYHDARAAEAVCGILRHQRLIDIESSQTALEEKWDLNRFLCKWLGYCLHRGHRFEPESRADPRLERPSLLTP